MIMLINIIQKEKINILKDIKYILLYYKHIIKLNSDKNILNELLLLQKTFFLFYKRLILLNCHIFRLLFFPSTKIIFINKKY